MSVSLQKGQKVSLTKGGPGGGGLSSVVVGLGWDEVQPKKGFFGSRRDLEDIDCDAAVFLLNNGRLTQNEDMVYFGNLKHFSGAVSHMGDNLTGGGEGDDEQIWVDLSMLPPEYDKVVFVVSIFQARIRKQHFGMIQNAYIRIMDGSNNVELCRYDLNDNYTGQTAMIFGEIYRYNGEWKFSAIGQATTDNSIQEIAKRYQ